MSHVQFALDPKVQATPDEWNAINSFAGLTPDRVGGAQPAPAERAFADPLSVGGREPESKEKNKAEKTKEGGSELTKIKQGSLWTVVGASVFTVGSFALWVAGAYKYNETKEKAWIAAIVIGLIFNIISVVVLIGAIKCYRDPAACAEKLQAVRAKFS